MAARFAHNGCPYLGRASRKSILCFSLAMLYSEYSGKIDAGQESSPNPSSRISGSLRGMLSAVYPVRNLFLTGRRIIPLESFASNGTGKRYNPLALWTLRALADIV